MLSPSLWSDLTTRESQSASSAVLLQLRQWKKPGKLKIGRSMNVVMRQYPQWAEKVPSLAETLSMLTHDGVTLNGKDGERADRDFLAKNILLWTPHIHFT